MKSVVLPFGDNQITKTLAYYLVSRDAKKKVVVVINQTRTGWFIASSHKAASLAAAVKITQTHGLRSMILYSSNPKITEAAKSTRRIKQISEKGVWYFQIVIPTKQPIPAIASLHVEAIKGL